MNLLINIIFLILIKSSFIITSSNYYVQKDGYICLSCPVVKENDTSSLVDFWAASKPGQPKPRWITLCRDQGKVENRGDDIPLLSYTCNNNQICLYQYKSTYPSNFQCLAGDGIAYVNITYMVQAKFITLIPEADYMNIEGSKLTVKENTWLNLTCEISETIPTSTVTLTIGDTRINSRGVITKLMNDDEKKLIYSYTVEIKKHMQNKNIICESKMIGIDEEIVKKLDLKIQLTKKFTLDVQYIPKCGNVKRQYNTGYNQTVIMECLISDANPNVTSFQLNGPTETSPIEQIIENGRQTGRFKVKPRSRSDLGHYECFPRNSAGSTTCSYSLILGGLPDAPTDCKIKYDRNSNRTRGQIDCKTGFNQNGTKLELNVYERLNDGTLKHAGSVNVYDSDKDEKTRTSVGYLTKELLETEYYEFVIIQTNNYGDSPSIVLTIGSREPEKSTFPLSKNSLIGIVGGIAGFILIVCLCCCCTNGFCSSSSSNDKTNDCFSSYCPCCCSNIDDKNDPDESTYKKTPYTEELLHSYVEDDASKYISADNGLIYTPMIETSKIDVENKLPTSATTKSIKDIEDVKYVKLPFHYQKSQQNNLVNSFKNELSFKLKKQRDEIESKLDGEGDNEETTKLNPNNLSTNVPNNHNPYETSSTSSSISQNDFINSNNNLISSGTIKKDKPPILKPKPRNIYSVNYSEVPKHLVQTNNNNNNNNSSSPSTSITDISSSNICSPHHDNDKYPMIPSRNDSLIRPKQKPPALPLASSLSASSSTVTTTFNRYITKQMNISTNEAIDVNYVNNNTLRRQNIIRNSDC